MHVTITTFAISLVYAYSIILSCMSGRAMGDSRLTKKEVDNMQRQRVKTLPLRHTECGDDVLQVHETKSARRAF